MKLMREVNTVKNSWSNPSGRLAEYFLNMCVLDSGGVQAVYTRLISSWKAQGNAVIE